MSKMCRTISQALFLVLFSILLFNGKIQVWMGIFVLSVILTFWLGRFYCGWICPINTAMKVVSKIKSRFKFNGLEIPEVFKKTAFRYSIFTVFILILIFMIISGKKLPVLPALFIAGLSLTIFFPENFYHHYLCPYGAILSLTGSKAKKHVKINPEECIQCGICRQVCPGDAVVEKDRYTISKDLCLICLKCAYQCPKQAIHYH